MTIENKKLKILYVDDETHNLVAFQSTFKRDYNIYIANSGAEGLKILSEQEIPIIFSDYRMPVMTGEEFLNICYKEYPDSMRILVSAYAHIGMFIKAINNDSIHRYIQKPWDVDFVKITIEELKELYFLKKHKEKQLKDLNSELQMLKNRLNEFSYYTIIIDEHLRTAIKQYLTFFSDFVRYSRNLQVHFEVRSTSTGIEIEFRTSENVEILKSYLNEYIGYIKLTEIDFSNMTPSHSYGIDKNQLVDRLRSEINHLRKNLEKEKVKSSSLSKTVDQFFTLLSVKENNVQKIINNYFSGDNSSANFIEGDSNNKVINNNGLSSENHSKLKSIGIEEKEIESLSQILKTSSIDKPNAKEKISKWLGQVTASIAGKGLYDKLPELNELVLRILHSL